MRRLMDAPSQRAIHILEKLADRKGWITIAELSDEVGASTRTIEKDLSMLRKRWGDNLQLEISRKNGVRLRNKNVANLGMILTELFNESVALRWIVELLFYPRRKIEFYEERLFASRSTLNRTLPKINQFLSSRGMEILNKSGKYEFVGRDEYYLRDFSTCFLIEMYGMDITKYDMSIDLKFIARLIGKSLSKYLSPKELQWVFSDDISLAYWSMFYFMSLLREENGYTIKSDYPVEEVTPYDLACIRRSFPHIGLNNLRAVYQAIFKQYRGWSSNEERVLVDNEAEALLRRLFSEMNVVQNEETAGALKLVVECLYLVSKLRPYKTSVLFDRIAYFALSVKEINPHFYNAAEKNLSVFSHNVKYDISSELNNFIYWVSLISPKLSTSICLRKVLLIDDFGSMHAKFLQKMFSQFFNSECSEVMKIDIYSGQGEPAEELIKDYDIVLTTVPKFHFSYPHAILINDYPSHEDFIGVYRAVYG